ncbi:hypothetical protein [Achromobacter sp.]|uniref:hypothetical protein n=1 Tax=Achromobacter sp. TaxID=134375 RepID=UPI0028AE9E78|nr:hypothetical protein [Achromobacter sp.]
MDDFIQLCEAYSLYIRSGFAKAECSSLVIALGKAGLPAHAEALNVYFHETGGELDTSRLPGFPGEQCVISTELPELSSHNDRWFDPLSLDFSVRTESRVFPRIAGRVVWVSVEPVRIWQYLVFLKLAKVPKKYPGASEVDDFMKGRFFGEISSKFVVNVYHEEAKAYAAWHGRGLVSHFDMEVVARDLSLSAFLEALPEGLSVWDGAVAMEDKRTVINGSGRGRKRGISVKECDEWFRHPEIGMVSCVAESIGLNRNRLEDHFSDEYITVTNHLCCL